jgi:ribosomal protein S25
MTEDMEDLAGLLDNLDKEESKTPTIPKKTNPPKIIENEDEGENKPKRKPSVSKDEFEELKAKFDLLSNKINQMIQTPQTASKVVSPNDIYFLLLKKYNLSGSITFKELKLLTSKEVPSQDHLKFLIRYKKNKSDYDLLYILQTS